MPNKLNKEEFDQGLTLQDLRVIIHALKMQGLTSSIDPRAEDAIRARIADLPSAEALLKLANNPKTIKGIVKEVGEIMHLMESYQKTNTEYRDRHQSVTGLPPRYRVLDWRKKMKAADSVKTLVKLSENLDNVGQGSLSNKIIVCAKKVRDNDKDEKYFSEVEKELIQAGFKDEAKMLREAGIGQWFSDKLFKFRSWKKNEMYALQKEFDAVGSKIKSLMEKVQKIYNVARQNNEQETLEQLDGIYNTLDGSSDQWANVSDEVRQVASEDGPVEESATEQGEVLQQTIESPILERDVGEWSKEEIDQVLALDSQETQAERKNVYYKIAAVLDENEKAALLKFKTDNPTAWKKIIERAKARKAELEGTQKAPVAAPTLTPATSPVVPTPAVPEPAAGKPSEAPKELTEEAPKELTEEDKKRAYEFKIAVYRDVPDAYDRDFYSLMSMLKYDLKEAVSNSPEEKKRRDGILKILKDIYHDGLFGEDKNKVKDLLGKMGDEGKRFLPAPAPVSPAPAPVSPVPAPAPVSPVPAAKKAVPRKPAAKKAVPRKPTPTLTSTPSSAAEEDYPIGVGASTKYKIYRLGNK